MSLKAGDVLRLLKTYRAIPLEPCLIEVDGLAGPTWAYELVETSAERGPKESSPTNTSLTVGERPDGGFRLELTLSKRRVDELTDGEIAILDDIAHLLKVITGLGLPPMFASEFILSSRAHAFSLEDPAAPPRVTSIHRDEVEPEDGER